MKTPDIFDLYTDYLITSFSYTTAAGLSGLVDNAISHDPVTRFLSQQDFTSKELGKVIKKTVREIEICWHYDHCVNRSVKGINLLNCVYYSKETSLPVAFE